MKIAKRLLLILISAVMMIGNVGCGMNSNDIAKEQKLFDEWLKEFLEEQELPSDYSKLSDGQRYSVKRIYEMIMYLQDKYGVEFEYTGYVRPQILEDEYLTAIPKGGNERTDTVTVTREDDGTLTDDYPNIAVRPYYEQMITDYVKEYFGSDKINVISSIDTSINDFKNISDENIKGNVYGINLIFISYDICSEQRFNEFVKDYGEWCKKNEYWGKGDIILLNENHSIGDIDIKKENYDDFLGKQQYKLRLHCSVKKGKEINIY